MKKQKLLTCASLFVLLGISSQALAAQEGKWLVRARVIDVIPQEDSTVTGADVSPGSKANLGISVVPELDVSYFFTPNIAVELIAGTTNHEVKLNHTDDLGNVWLLPPTLTLQYHFTQLDYVKPYVGAGVNYTHFYNASSGSVGSVHYNDSVGTVLQTGFDVPIRDNWSFNFDIKKIWVNTDVSINQGATRASVDINPLIIGTGIGYRF